MFGTYRRVWPLISARQRRHLVPLLLLMLVTAILDLAGVASILPFLAVLSNPDIIETRPALRGAYDFVGAQSHLAFLQVLGLVVFAVTLISICAKAAVLYFTTRFVRAVAVDLGSARLRQFLSRPYEWFLGQHSADLSKSVLEEIQQIVSNTIAPSMRVLSNGVVLVLLAAFLIFIEPVGASAAVILFVLAFGGVYARLRNVLRDVGRDRRVAVRERFQVTAEVMGGIKDVKLHGLEETYVQRFLAPSRRLARHLAQVTLLSEVPRFVLEALSFGGILAFVLYLLWSRSGGVEAVLPVLGAFAFAGLKMMPMLQMLFRDVSVMRFGEAGLAALAEDMESYRPGPAPPVPRSLQLRHSIALNGVSYRYPGASRDVIRDVSFEIRVGSSVGIVGPTGAGKSTVIDILLGLLVPSEGALLVDGVAIEDHNRRAWQRNIGYVPQSIYLATGTIAENIAVGVAGDQIDEAAVRRAARLANVDAFVKSLDDGYRTEVGENGLRLSGGQRQRIGIARALYGDPAVIVFDEATSALDSVAERAVIEAIGRLGGEKTVLMITHRLRAVGRCDTILMFRDGRLVASGNYQTLLNENAEFRDLAGAADAGAGA